jgi:hypothetical protein
MSNKTRYVWAGLFFLFVVLTGCVATPRAQQQTSYFAASEKGSASELADLHKQILRYKTWQVVNPEAADMSLIISAACAQLIPPKIADPHKKFVRVYVNDVGRSAMMEQKIPVFPVGTIIVKEKLPEKYSQKPEFFTIMVKREPSYDKDHGDWQYLTMEADMAKVEKPATLENCQSCHASWKAADFVSRMYLSPEQRMKLR